MHFFVSILQCLAKYFFGVFFAENSSPRFPRSADALGLRNRSQEKHWPGVGWMKVRLVLEEFCGIRCPCMVPLRAPYNLRVGPRADILQPDDFLPESAPPSYIRHCFSPPDFPGM
jgi:hypothetical protein